MLGSSAPVVARCKIGEAHNKGRAGPFVVRGPFGVAAVAREHKAVFVGDGSKGPRDHLAQAQQGKLVTSFRDEVRVFFPNVSRDFSLHVFGGFVRHTFSASSRQKRRRASSAVVRMLYALKNRIHALGQHELARAWEVADVEAVLRRCGLQGPWPGKLTLVTADPAAAPPPPTRERGWKHRQTVTMPIYFRSEI